MDLARVTPAPWHDDGYRIYGPTDDADKRNGGVITEYKHSDHVMPDDGEFIALARNAMDVMIRRAWWASPIFGTAGTIWSVYHIRGDGVKATVAGFQAWPDPFTALVEAEKWYRENVERKQ